MSKKSKAVILGPDGKPVDVATMRRKTAPEPVPELSIGNADGGSVLPVKSFTLNYGHSLIDSVCASILGDYDKRAPKPRSLKDAVADDVASLTADFDGHGHPELPAPPADLTAYRDAYRSAAANCLHDDAVELLYGREWTCDACGRHIDRDEMRRACSKKGMGYWLFGGGS